MALLSERVPYHPVVLQGLHSFAAWGNRLAFAAVGITAGTPDPTNGEIRTGPDGTPTGIVVDRATSLLMDAVPPPTEAQLERNALAGLEEMAANGYVAVHEAGASADEMLVLETLEAEGRLPIRVYAMLSGRRWADITIMDLDPLAVGDTNSARLFDRRILYTIVAGQIAYEAN